MRAFVSYVRGYKEHQCRFIFRLPDLNVGRLATAFGVLRIPKVGDLRKPKGLEDFSPSAVDPESVKFKDKARRALGGLSPRRKRPAASACCVCGCVRGRCARARPPTTDRPPP